MKYVKRIVDTEIWDSKLFNEVFTPEDKYFYLYLLTNTRTTQLGVYKISRKAMSYDTGYTKEAIDSLLDRFQTKYEMVKYNTETNEIAVKNYLKHSIVKGGKPVLDCLIQDEKKINDKALVPFAISSLANDPEVNATVKEFISLYINDNDNDNERNVDESYHESYNESSSQEQLEHFNIIRDLYPRVRWGSKAKALKTYKEYITTGRKGSDNKKIKLTERQIYYAVKEYIRQQEELNTEHKYYKNFETLMNNINDYVVESEEDDNGNA